VTVHQSAQQQEDADLRIFCETYRRHDMFSLKKDFIAHMKGKGKAFPLQAWTDPEGSRRLRLPYFKTIGT